MLKDSPTERLADGIRAVAAGRRQIENALLELQEDSSRPSERDCVLLHYVREGQSNADIAAALALSEGPVKNVITCFWQILAPRTASRLAVSLNKRAGLESLQAKRRHVEAVGAAVA